MTFQAYLDNIKTKTGKTPDDFRKLAAQKSLTNYREIMAWLKSDFGLGHGHANTIAQLLVNADKFKADPDKALAAHFEGNKAKWRKPYATLAAKIAKFGSDVKLGPNRSYINILRGTKKIGIVQISSADRIDIGIKLKGVKPIGRLEAAGSWNIMVTHRVRISGSKQIDAEVLAWLKQAYHEAQDSAIARRPLPAATDMKIKQSVQPARDLPTELASPARRALAGAGIQRLDQLAKFSEDEVKQLHGIGPNAVVQLRHALSAKGLSFANRKEIR